MSLILDALRKSEAERRRAQVPDLFAQTALAATAQPHARRGGWRWAAAGVLTVAAVAWGLSAWWPAPTPMRPHPAPPPQAGEGVEAPHSSAAVAPPPAAPSAPARGGARPHPAPPSPTPVPLTRLRERVGEGAPPAPEVPDSRPRQDDASAVAPPQADDALRLADLGVEERKQLPPLKLSVHLWDGDPARRFVILDGQRLGEGDRIGEAVVEQITRDGVVLAWNGRRLRLSLP
ncbi:general secretion pathway protein GspB [Vulcaniibacterium gelatinicum]|uniref:general secretion pathway protein GspB n=1 Tax=Vulcaniibacterium gelatinicum TaxID=2598725 RepID=UPI0011CA68BD|nr:general secretion pathway protein GspB [Vulcaniibacterium gelatinicum]